MFLREDEIKRLFEKLTKDYGASTMLGIQKNKLYRIKQNPSLKNMLYVLYKADKLKIDYRA